jgi:hypothetical protein
LKNNVGASDSSDFFSFSVDISYPYSELESIIDNRPGLYSDYRNNFSTAATETMESIIDLHHDIMFFLIIIITIVV